MKPSDFSTSRTRPRIVEAGVETVSRRRICALRMRVSISAIGSLRLIPCVSLPARLDHAGHLPEVPQLAQSDTAQLELAIVAARTAGELAAVAHTARRRIARQLGQLELGSEALLDGNRLVHRDFLELAALAGKLLGKLDAAVVLLDGAGLCHFSVLALRLLPEGEIEGLEQRPGLVIGLRRRAQ